MKERKMKITCWWAVTLTLLCSSVVLAVQHTSNKPMGDMSSTDPVWSELNSSMEKMHKAMSTMKPTGNADVDFVRMMLPHHQAAIDMAKTQLLYGKDAQMRRLAQEIITDQQSEIAVMQLWLKPHEPKH